MNVPTRSPPNLSRKLPAFAMSVFVAMSALAVTFAAFSMHAPQVSAYSPHAPISITGNLQFTAGNGVTGGNGTITDPYIISGWEILSTSGNGIYVSGTDKYFIIQDVLIHGSGFYDGIHFSFVTHGSIINSTLTANFDAIRLDDSNDITIADSNLDDQSASGVIMFYSRFVTIRNNSIDRVDYAVYGENGDRDISVLSNSMDNSRYGGLLITGQGLRFTIVGNTISTSGSGNGVDLQTAPTSNYIADNTLNGNSVNGIILRDVALANVIRNNTVTSSGAGDGIALLNGDGNVIENNIVSGNSGSGIYMGLMTSVGQNWIANNTADGNDWGIYCESSGGSWVVNNTVYGNLAGGIEFEGNDGNISNNNISDNLNYGLFLGPLSPRTTVTGNTFVNDGMFGTFLFSDDNVVTSNTVNGKPLVYLERVNGYTVPVAGQVIAKDSSNITVNGLDLSNATVGVELWNSVDCTVQGADLSGNLYGIYMDNGSQRNTVLLSNLSGDSFGAYIYTRSNFNTVTQCTINDNTGVGVSLGYSNNNTVASNDLIGNAGAIEVFQSQDTMIRNNFINNGGFGVLVYYATNLTVKQNDMVNVGSFGVYLYSTVQSTVIDNHINAISFGIYLLWSSNWNTIKGNTVYQGTEGIYITGTNPSYPNIWNTISGNNITDNTNNGIWLAYAQHNTLLWNNATGNGYGIQLNSSGVSANWIYLNNFSANGVNAYSDCPLNSNWWNTSAQIAYQYGGKPFTGYLGNRYGDYSGSDGNGDGVGDTPYNVGKERDNYPLMNTPSLYLIPEFPGFALIALVLIALLAGTMFVMRRRTT